MLSSDHLLALGTVVVEAAALERIVTDIAKELIDDDPAVGTAALHGLLFKQISDRVMPLAESRQLTLRTARRLNNELDAARSAMDSRNGLVHSFWIVEGDDGDPALQSRSEYPRITRRERRRVHTPGGSKVTYVDRSERLPNKIEYALEVLPEDIHDVAEELSKASTALHQTWFQIAKELGRSHPDETDPTLESYPNRQFVDVTTIRPSPRGGSNHAAAGERGDGGI